jgi:preprotein translocase subunit SecY
MDSENKFWLGFWTIVGVVLFTIIVSTTIYNINYNAWYFAAWNNCVTSGGKPTRESIMGSDVTAFTCVRT